MATRWDANQCQLQRAGIVNDHACTHPEVSYNLWDGLYVASSIEA